MKNFLKKFALVICLVPLWQINIYAQNELDALRFSEHDWQGTARFMGAGKAFGAVGAEFSALNTNPASIGLYKKNDVTFTPLTVSIYKNTSNYKGTVSPGQTVKYNLNNAGVVFALPGVANTQWKKFQIGFGYNRIQNYNNNFSIEGRSNGGTIGNVFAQAAEGTNCLNDPIDWPSDETWMAWESYLIYPKNGSSTSYIAKFEGEDMKHISNVTRTGGNDEMIFSFGTNYGDKLFMGTTIGLPFISFTENRTFKEINDKKADIYIFQDLEMIDKLSVRAIGLNLKVGAIYQPLDFFRVGVAFHTPTYYGNVKEIFERKMTAHYYAPIDSVTEVFTKAEAHYNNSNNYALTTPLRAMLNRAFLIKQRAFISAEYEFTDYSMANMYAVEYNFSEENKTIQNMYGFSHIARIGAELNINQIFSIRAGYNYISSPYKNNINDGSKHYASLGFGFRTKYFSGDFAYALTTSKEKYWMYDATFVNAVDQKFLTHRIVMSFGVRF
jgi:hypothetical protein